MLFRYVKNKLIIRYERSFKPEEMGDIEKSIERPLQNDSIFYDGSFLFRFGMGSDSPFSEKYGW